MKFLEIRLLNTPKILFACTANIEQYQNSFHRRAGYLELCLLEKGPIRMEFSDGTSLVAREKTLSVVDADMDCETYPQSPGTLRHTTVGIQAEYRATRWEDPPRKLLAQLEEKVIAVPGTFLVPFMESLSERYMQVLHALQRIGYLNASWNPADKLRAISAYYNLCGLLTDIVLQERNSGVLSPAARNYVLQAKEYIHTHFSEKITVGDIAAHLNISEGYLHKLFRAETGHGPLEYCNIFRVETAIQCMEARKLTLKEASIQVGIDDPCYMSRLFRRVTGMSLREYQSLRREERSFP